MPFRAPIVRVVETVGATDLQVGACLFTNTGTMSKSRNQRA